MYSLQCSSIFRRAKASCLCSYCWSRHFSFYDRGRLWRVEIATLESASKENACIAGYLKYRFLSQYRVPCQAFGKSHFLSSGQIPYPVKKLCFFPEPRTIFRPSNAGSRECPSKPCWWRCKRFGRLSLPNPHVSQVSMYMQPNTSLSQKDVEEP